MVKETLTESKPFDDLLLEASNVTDLTIIGAGITGLSAALSALNIGMKTIDLIAARVIGGTPSSNTILIIGNEKDHIKIADITIMK